MDTFSTDSSDKCLPRTAAQVDIVIVNWNSGLYLADCLETISQLNRDVVAAIFLVDNASSDDSLSCLKVLDLPITTIRNSTNQGFARACNQGASMGSAPFILFLNPDTRLFENSLLHPLSFMTRKENSHIGICGIQMLDEKRSVSRSCAYFPTFLRLTSQILGLASVPGFRSLGVHMSDWPHTDTRVVNHVIGAFFLVRRTLFERLNGFDERFFVYLEDVDFSFRAKQMNFRSIYLNGAQAFHAGGGSSRRIKTTRLFYSLQSRLLYAFKHFPAWQSWILVGLTIVIEPLTRVLYCVGRGRWHDIRHTLGGYRKLLKVLPSILRSRRKMTCN